MLRRLSVCFVVLSSLLLLPVQPAQSAQSVAEIARAKAQGLAKEGRTLEAASELRVAAESAGADAPLMRFESALMLQRSGELRDAISLHTEVARDSGANFDLRVRARYAQELLFWTLEFSALAAPALDDAATMRAQVDELGRLTSGLESEERDLAKRLRLAAVKINESRSSLSALVGPGDPMIQELSALANACSEQKMAIVDLGKKGALAARSSALATRSLTTIDKGVEVLTAFVNSLVEQAKLGKGDLRTMKKQHDALLKRGSRVAKGASGRLASIDAAIAQAREALKERERLIQQIEDVVGTAEIVLGTNP